MYKMFNISKSLIPGYALQEDVKYSEINSNSSPDVPVLVPSIHINFPTNYKEGMCLTLYDDQITIDKRIENIYFEINGDVITISTVALFIRLYGWLDGERFVIEHSPTVEPVKSPVIRFTIDNTYNYMDHFSNNGYIMKIEAGDLKHRGIIYSDDGLFIYNKTISRIREITEILEWPRQFMGFSLNEIFEHLGNYIKIIDIRTETRGNMNVN